MSFLILVLVDLAASDDDSPLVSLSRRPVEALIEDWLRRGEEIRSLRDLLGVEAKRIEPHK